jgi:hypothetical protein
MGLEMRKPRSLKRPTGRGMGPEPITGATALDHDKPITGDGLT